MKQKDNENILDEPKRLKQAKENLEAHVGKDIIGHYKENLEEFRNVT